MLSVILHYSYSEGIDEAIAVFLVNSLKCKTSRGRVSQSKPKILLTTWKHMKETYFFNIDHIYYTFKALKWEKNRFETTSEHFVFCPMFILPLIFFNLPSASNEHVT